MIRYQSSTPALVGSPPSCRTALVSRLADDMREMAFAGQNVSPETLAQRGWSQPAVKRLSAAAIAQARRQSVRRQS